MAAHRYWRIMFTGPGNQAGQIDLGWVKLFETVDIDATVAASPSSVGGTAIDGEHFSGTYLPSRAFTYTNSETGDNWATLASTATYGTTKWIGYDFGAGNAKDIVAYSISYYSSYMPWEWVFQYSDDASSWTTVHTVTGFRFEANTTHYFRCPTATLTGAGYRFWRIHGSGSGTVLSIGEIQLRTAVGGSNVLVSPYHSLRADSFNGDAPTSYGTRKALDGTTGFLSNSWRSQTDSGAHWWMVDFGKRMDIKECVLNTGPAGETRGITKLQGSHDAANWIDHGTFAAFTSGYQQQTLLAAAAISTRRRPVIVSM